MRRLIFMKEPFRPAGLDDEQLSGPQHGAAGRYRSNTRPLQLGPKTAHASAGEEVKASIWIGGGQGPLPGNPPGGGSPGRVRYISCGPTPVHAVRQAEQLGSVSATQTR